jgi:perosamine synthetase
LKKYFPVSQPSIGDKELAYVSDAVKSGWVSSIGKYIEQFESMFAAFCGTRYALAVSNGTTALHLALVSAGVKAGDEVIVPDLTFVASANAVAYTGAKVVLVDIDPRTLCIDAGAVERAITSRTRAVIPVHLYGHAAHMGELAAITAGRRILLLEDAAEAHGAEFDGRRVGSIGDCGIFSFYGNKVITSGEGGMLTTNDREIYQKAKLLRDHAMSAEKRYWHTEIGFNYRMTNLQAALGVAQMERIDEFIAKRRQVMQWYRDCLGTHPKLRLNREAPGTKNVYWMVCLEIEGISEDVRTVLMTRLRSVGVDTRPYFYPISDMPMYERAETPVAHEVSRRGMNLPSYTDLSEGDVRQISESVMEVLTQMDVL